MGRGPTAGSANAGDDLQLGATDTPPTGFGELLEMLDP
jgi:hypothetical protein